MMLHGAKKIPAAEFSLIAPAPMRCGLGENGYNSKKRQNE